MKVAFLLTGLSGYFASCLEALACRPGIEVLVITEALSAHAAFESEHVSPRGVQVHTFCPMADQQQVLRMVTRFAPDVLGVVGWQVRPYRYVARHLRPRPLRVLCMDNQWLATPKQVLGVLSSSVYVRPLFDYAFLPGERQVTFAKKLGFAQERIWPGLYSCDHARFSPAFEARRTAGPAASPKCFLFAGRLVSSKGVDVLAEAYGSYRSAV